MTVFQKHEQFEMEVLDYLKSHQLLGPLAFGGGTMLRLCHEMERYSADLDFWFVKTSEAEEYFKKCEKVLGETYQLTGAQNEHYTLLFELRSVNYPRRLKIEIRKESDPFIYEESIAFSPFARRQVMLRTHTLEQCMANKIKAMQERNEIRDAYDIEFLLRKGIKLGKLESDLRQILREKINRFTDLDFKVKLGSVLPPQLRRYYIEQGFRLLRGKLTDTGIE